MSDACADIAATHGPICLSAQEEVGLCGVSFLFKEKVNSYAYYRNKVYDKSKYFSIHVRQISFIVVY